MPLIDLLVAASGVDLDLKDPNILTGPLLNGASGTAMELMRRGARMDIRHAAALGRLDLVQQFFSGVDLDASLIPLPDDPSEARARIEEAFIRACQFGHNAVCEFLLHKGVDPTAQVNVGQTGLHYAAHAGQLETVKLLIARGVPLEVKNEYGGTVLGQALWSAFNEPKETHLAIVDALIDAGADIKPEWNKAIDELRRREDAKPK